MENLQSESIDYFESMSWFPGLSMHTGGIKKTSYLLSKAKLKSGDHILEVGSGTGASTRLLLQAGLDVTVIDPNFELLSAALAYCSRTCIKSPHSIHAEIENANLPDQTFDAALMECVFGFIKDKGKALKHLKKALKPGRFICMNDFYYHSEPDQNCIDQLNKITSGNITYFTKSDYINFFAKHGFFCLHWEDIPKSSNGEFKESHLSILDDDSKKTFASLSMTWRSVFEENKHFTNAFLALWISTTNQILD